MDDLDPVADSDPADDLDPIDASDGAAATEPSAFSLLLPAVLAVVVGVVVGLVLAVAWGRFGDDDPGEPSSPLFAPTPTSEPAEAAEARLADAAEFLNAWRRWRGIEVAVEYEVTRVRGDSERTSEALLVQKPPTRMVAEFGAITGIADGRAVECDWSTGERFCNPDVEALDYQTFVDTELAAMRSVLASEPPGYVASYRDDCWQLVMLQDPGTQPFGLRGEVCFDDETGALDRARYEFADGLVETRKASRIRTTVEEADFASVTEEVFD
ncbi:MAG: hypothetical protein HKN26_06130 [Acidimicrobiales bacterium]|nr:hypothetical protein [Acidimicrobiales bacterium]